MNTEDELIECMIAAIQKDIQIQAKLKFEREHEMIMDSMNKKKTHFQGIFSIIKNIPKY